MINRIKQTLPAGIGFAIIGLLSGLYVWHNNIANLGDALIIPATLAGLVTGMLLWWWLIIKPQRCSVKYGAMVGALIGTAAHPLCWYFNVIKAHICFYILQNGHCQQAPMNFIAALPSSIVYAYLSLYTIGWLTVMLGAILGTTLNLTNAKRVTS